MLPLHPSAADTCVAAFPFSLQQFYWRYSLALSRQPALRTSTAVALTKPCRSIFMMRFSNTMRAVRQRGRWTRCSKVYTAVVLTLTTTGVTPAGTGSTRRRTRPTCTQKAAAPKTNVTTQRTLPMTQHSTNRLLAVSKQALSYSFYETFYTIQYKILVLH